MGLIVLPLQYILVNICMHDQAKKWGGGGGAPAHCSDILLQSLSL